MADALRPRLKRSGLATLLAALLTIILAACVDGLATETAGPAGAPSPASPAATTPPAAPPAATPPTVAPAPAPGTGVPAGPGTLQVRVTDAPGDADQVLVTVDEVEVHVAGPEAWLTVVEDPEPFDLVALNGVEAVLGESELEPGRYTQVRLHVETVEVVRGGETVTARVPGGTIKLVGSFEIEPGLVTIATLDFDLDRSLVAQGNGGFLFKPVVKLITSNPGGNGGPGGTLPAGPGGTLPPGPGGTLPPAPGGTPPPAPGGTLPPGPGGTLPATAPETPSHPDDATGDQPGVLFLEIEQPPGPETVVDAPEFEVVGRSSADAVVTVNGTAAELDRDGRFDAEVALEEGSNTVEVVARADSGQELSEVLLLTYAPAGEDADAHEHADGDKGRESPGGSADGRRDEGAGEHAGAGGRK